jgi:hypothetical protein
MRAPGFPLCSAPGRAEPDRAAPDACAPEPSNPGRGLRFPIREAGFFSPPGCRKVRRAGELRPTDGSAPSPTSKERRSRNHIAPRGGTAPAGTAAKSAPPFDRSDCRARSRRDGLRCRKTTPAGVRQQLAGRPRCLQIPVDKPRPFDSFDFAKMVDIPGGSASSYGRATSRSRVLREGAESRRPCADKAGKPASPYRIRPAGIGTRPRGRRGAPPQRERFGIFARCA